MAMGLGLTFGPLTGVIVYRVLSYAGTMFFFSLVVYFVGTYSLNLIPLNLDADEGSRHIGVKVSFTESPNSINGPQAKYEKKPTVYYKP